MGTMQWKAHFRNSLAREREFDWSAGIALASDERGPVVDALQTFQRGLSSPGLNLRSKVRANCDRDYAECVDLYVREKSVHADLLANCLWELDAAPTKRHAADFVFRRFRRRFEWTRELLVLLTAEMTAMPVLRIMANNVSDPLLKDVLESILRDESFHLGFHIDQLRPVMQQRTSAENVAIQAAWGGLFTSSLTWAMTDLKGLFEAYDYSRLAFWTDAWNLFAQVQTGINGSEHLNAMLSRDPRLNFAL